MTITADRQFIEDLRNALPLSASVIDSFVAGHPIFDALEAERPGVHSSLLRHFNDLNDRLAELARHYGMEQQRAFDRAYKIGQAQRLTADLGVDLGCDPVVQLLEAISRSLTSTPAAITKAIRTGVVAGRAAADIERARPLGLTAERLARTVTRGPSSLPLVDALLQPKRTGRWRHRKTKHNTP